MTKIRSQEVYSYTFWQGEGGKKRPTVKEERLPLILLSKWRDREEEEEDNEAIECIK